MSHVHIKIRVTGLIYVRHDSFICDMTHVCATWLVYMWHDSFVCDMTHVCATWLVHVQRALLVSTWSWLPQGFFFLFWMILVVRSFRNNNIIVIGALTLTKEACDMLSVYSPNCKGKRTQAKTGKIVFLFQQNCKSHNQSILVVAENLFAVIKWGSVLA